MNLMPSKETIKTFSIVVVAILATEMFVKPLISKMKKTVTPVK